MPVFLLLLGGLYFLTRSDRRVAERTAPARRPAHAERRRRRARDDTQRGLLDLAAGRWRSAEELLTRAAPEADSPAVNYVVAARAADLQDAVDATRRMARARAGGRARRTRGRAGHARRNADAARPGPGRLADARAARRVRRPEFARPRADGTAVPEARPRRAAARARRRDCAARRNCPRRRSTKLLAQVQLEEVRAAGERARCRSGRPTTWSDRAARDAQRLPQAVVAYARALMTCGRARSRPRNSCARRSTTNAETRRWCGCMASSCCPTRWRRSSARRAGCARHPEDPELLATSARKLALRADLIGKARSYLEASTRTPADAENSLLYAELLEQLGEGDRARRCCATAWRGLGAPARVPRVRLRRR